MAFVPAESGFGCANEVVAQTTDRTKPVVIRAQDTDRMEILVMLPWLLQSLVYKVNSINYLKRHQDRQAA
jgi:hypothetical protein